MTSSYVATSTSPSKRLSSACCVGMNMPPYVPSNAHLSASLCARLVRLRSPCALPALRAFATSGLGAFGSGEMGPTPLGPCAARSCLSAVRSCGVAFRAFVGWRLGLLGGVGACMSKSTNAAFVSFIRLAFVGLDAFVRLLAFAGLLAFVRLLASEAANFALLAALRSARVNFRPVFGQ